MWEKIKAYLPFLILPFSILIYWLLPRRPSSPKNAKSLIQDAIEIKTKKMLLIRYKERVKQEIKQEEEKEKLFLESLYRDDPQKLQDIISKELKRDD